MLDYAVPLEGEEDTTRFVTEFVTNAARLVGYSDAESELLERLEDSLQRAVSPEAEDRDLEWLRVYFAVSRIVPLVPSRLRVGSAYRDMRAFLDENVDMLNLSA
jgi:hypothetical protein